MHTPQLLVFRAAFLTVLLAALIGCGGGEPPAPPTLDIPVMKLTTQDVPIYVDMVGQTKGSVDIPIRARVEGFLESKDFQEGFKVKKGALLYTIDKRPFESMVVEAQGHVAEERTALALAKADLDRIRPLAEMKAVSAQDLDSAQSQYDAAIGALQAAEAQLEQANIELGYCSIHSPIDGLIGITQAEVGEFVGAPPNPVILNYVSKIDPIRVRFSINEQDYLKFVKDRRAKGISGGETAFAERTGGPLILILADSEQHPYKGKLSAIDAAINPTTGTFMLEADFPNPDRVVLSGQFARVRGEIDVRKNVIVVPQSAIAQVQGIFQAFVVNEQNQVEIRQIKVGPSVDNKWIVESGLKVGERIALEGMLRLKNKMTVNPQLTDPNKPPEQPQSGAF